jgi:hypothetical protein
VGGFSSRVDKFDPVTSVCGDKEPPRDVMMTILSSESPVRRLGSAVSIGSFTETFPNERAAAAG